MNSTKLYKVCSLLMGLLFAYSASVQLDDHGMTQIKKSYLIAANNLKLTSMAVSVSDWYFWLPLYGCAAFVNLVRGISLTPRWRFAAKLGLALGLCLLMKVVAEDTVYGLAGFWSMDLSRKVVREKIGSGLVVVSMFLQLKALESPSSANYKNGKRRLQISTCVQYGATLLVGVGYGLPFVFFVVRRGQMNFD